MESGFNLSSGSSGEHDTGVMYMTGQARRLCRRRRREAVLLPAFYHRRGCLAPPRASCDMQQVRLRTLHPQHLTRSRSRRRFRVVKESRDTVPSSCTTTTSPPMLVLLPHHPLLLGSATLLYARSYNRGTSFIPTAQFRDLTALGPFVNRRTGIPEYTSSKKRRK